MTKRGGGGERRREDKEALTNVANGHVNCVNSVAAFLNPKTNTTIHGEQRRVAQASSPPACGSSACLFDNDANPNLCFRKHRPVLHRSM